MHLFPQDESGSENTTVSSDLLRVKSEPCVIPPLGHATLQTKTVEKHYGVFFSFFLTDKYSKASFFNEGVNGISTQDYTPPQTLCVCVCVCVCE